MVHVIEYPEAEDAVRAVFAEPDIERVFDALQATTTDVNRCVPSGSMLQLVGGAMRDIFLGNTPSDLDFATPLKPDDVVRALADAGIKVHATPRARAHGTISVKLSNRVIEITTLRIDNATDGRHARVRWTNGWGVDADRRDFTINAIYGAYDGTIIDWHNGVGDLRAGKLRFIGDADTRVAEDALRVLRYFRFMAMLEFEEWDADALAACCTAARTGALAGLSVERMWRELSQILANPCHDDLHSTLADMSGAGVLQAVLGDDIHLAKDWRNRLQEYADTFYRLPYELKYDVAHRSLCPTSRQDAVARLELISGGEPEAAQKRFKLAREDRLEPIDGARFESRVAWNGLCQDIYDSMGRVLVNAPLRYALLVARVYSAANHGIMPGGVAYDDLALAALEWQDKRLPIDGNDLRKMGISEGAQVGEVKGEVRAWWLGKDREPTRDACLSYAGARIAAKHAPLDNPAV